MMHAHVTVFCTGGPANMFVRFYYLSVCGKCTVGNRLQSHQRHINAARKWTIAAMPPKSHNTAALFREIIRALNEAAEVRADNPKVVELRRILLEKVAAIESAEATPKSQCGETQFAP